jgi:putative transposase
LLKFGKDQRVWVKWLYEAHKRYGIVVLNFMVTSNHIHLLAVDESETGVLASTMQLIAGRTGQAFVVIRRQPKNCSHVGQQAA